MNLWTILCIALAAALMFFLVLPAFVIFFAVFSRKKPVPFEDYDQKKYKNHYYMPYLGRIGEARDSLRRRRAERVCALSYDGLRLCGEYYSQGACRTAILFHGIGAELYTNLSSQARFLFQNGFNVLLVCHRAHAPSQGRFTTIGLREQYDVLSWVDWAEEHGAREILLYGVSMGGASVAFASDKLGGTKVKAIVSDSGFYSVYEQMKRDAKKLHIPGWMVPVQRVLARAFLRVDLKDNTAESLSKSAVPVFFLHGTDDETVEYRWSEKNYAACSAPKQLLLVEGAPHTLSLLTDETAVGNALAAFINTYFTKQGDF